VPDWVVCVKRLADLMRPYRWGISVATALGVATTVSEGIGITLLLPILQNATGASSFASLPYLSHSLRALGVPSTGRSQYLLGVVFGAIVLKALLSYANTVFISWVDLSVGHRLRCRVLDELMRVDQRYLDVKGSGRLFNTLATETWRTGEAVRLLVGALVSVCTIVVFASMMLVISWRMTLVVCTVLGLVTGVSHLLTNRVQQAGHLVVESNARLAELMVDVLSGMAAIQAFGSSDSIRNQFVQKSDEVRRGYGRIQQLGALTSPVTELSYAAVFAGILLLAISSGGTAVASTLVLLILLVRLQGPVKNLLYMKSALAGNMGAVSDITNVLSPRGKHYIVSGSKPFHHLSHGIRFESVTFRYAAEEKPALSNVSFEIGRGRMVAIVGSSGAGKSTVANLLLRRYDVTEGRITVDGTPLTELDITHWRKGISVVPQDIHLFSDTVRQNIALGSVDATNEDIAVAADSAYAGEFIAQLSASYQTKLGENGVRLSGGQRQRLALARAFLHRGEILVLDEATSWLDAVSEMAVQDAISALRGFRTLVVITHRLDTIRGADHVIVLENGKVIEEGSPELVLQRDGVYSYLSSLQPITVQDEISE
jgi:subfamily B ATP-binding cassette protein MsbA